MNLENFILRNLEPNVFGILYFPKNGEGGTTFRSCRIISTHTENMEYQISIKPVEGESYRVQDYHWNTCFPLTDDGKGKITIKWRVKDHPEINGKRVISYHAK